MNKHTYAPIKIMDTANMSEEEFSFARQKIGEICGGVSFGGSDVAAIFGLSKWTSPLELFEQKRGIKPKLNFERNTYAKTAGHALEEAVAQLTLVWFSQNEPQLKVEITNDTGMYQHGDFDEETGEFLYPFAVANLDRIITINGKRGILECKTLYAGDKVSKALWRSGQVPIYYELQVRYYMEIMNLDYCVVSCLWGTSPADMAVIIVRRNFEKGKLLMETVKHFANAVLGLEEPVFEDCDPYLLSDYYTRKFGEVEEKETVELNVDELTIVEALSLEDEIFNLKKKLEEKESEKELLYTQLYPLMKNADKGVISLPDGSKAYLTLKTSYKRQYLMTEKVKNDYPDIYKNYITEGFNESLFKKDYPDLYQECLSKKEVNPDGKNTFKILKKRTITTKGGQQADVWK